VSACPQASLGLKREIGKNKQNDEKMGTVKEGSISGWAISKAFEGEDPDRWRGIRVKDWWF
jgi:hypothetical protein